MMGVVRNAETDAPLAGALVVVMWTGMNIGDTSLSKLPKAVHTTVSDRGSYRVCGIPNGVALRAQARLGTKASGWIDVTMPPGGVLQRNFLVGERVAAAAAAGTPPQGRGRGGAEAARQRAAATERCWAPMESRSRERRYISWARRSARVRTRAAGSGWAACQLERRRWRCACSRIRRSDSRSISHRRAKAGWPQSSTRGRTCWAR